jgi:citrate lyase beta subunit
VPGSDPRKIEKAAGLGADEVFLDLEDACAPSEKEAARRVVVDALTRLQFKSATVGVRVNDLTTPWGERDIAEIVSATAGHLDAVIVPKVESAAQVLQVAEILAGVEHQLGRPLELEVELLIESAAGAVELREIARASNRVVALVFGPGDYAASLGVPRVEIGGSDPRYPGEQWHWVMSSIVAHAKATRLLAIDGPLGDFSDERRFRESAQRARLLGFDGKWCIHPNQIEWANDAFSPTSDEIHEATRIVEAYEAALARGEGAVAVDGKLVDEVSMKLAQATIRRVDAIGGST